jgi:molecular chaperone DnaJ
MSNYYDILGVSKTASQDEIKKAYRKIAHQYHPDKTQGDKDSEVKFKEANNAYETLSDPSKRANYDRFGDAGANMGAGGMGGFGGMSGGFNPFGNMGGMGGSQSYSFNMGGFEAEGLDDILNSFFGGGSNRSNSDPGSGRSKGVDLQMNFELTLEEIATGSFKSFNLKHNIACARCDAKGSEPNSKVTTCNTCKGKGQVYKKITTIFGVMQQPVECPDCTGTGKTFEQACRDCKGKGFVVADDKIKIDIPVGIKEGERIRIRGKGEAGYRGSAPGDLFLLVNEKKHSEFERDGMDIYSNLKLNYLDLIVGKKLKINTVWGQTDLNIPVGTNPNDPIILSEKGMPKLNNAKLKGKHIINIQVVMPKLNSKQINEIKNIIS